MFFRRASPRYFRGDLVEVRSLSEILATLDDDRKLDGVPFMREMTRFCGQRFRVFHRADKTCVEGYGVRRMRDTVLLEGLRCDGSWHDGCQRHCLLFWKEAWLRPANVSALPANVPSPSANDRSLGDECLTTRKSGRYFCQSTELADATLPMSRWNVVHFLQDLIRGDVSLGRLAEIIVRMVANRVRSLVGLKKIGMLAGIRKKTRRGDLNLKPGERVIVLSPREIAETLNDQGRNCGLSFEPDMLEHCGKRYQVAFPIERIISEETGQLIKVTGTVVLDGVVCQGLCAKNCPRANPFYWRESWLRRVAPSDASADAGREAGAHTRG